MEILNVNDATTVNYTLESLAKTHYEKIHFRELVEEHEKKDHGDTDHYFNEDSREFHSIFQACLKTKSDLGISPSDLDKAELTDNSFYNVP